MNRAFSIYLDAVRFLAAVMVYLYHSNQRLLIQDVLPLSRFGHSAVIVFFVLSGFVIAYVTDTKERQWTTYSASRISRVFSVALPAVLLTLLLDTVGRALYPVLYSGYPYDQFVIRSAAALGMANEIWFVSITSFSNVPYWSICYESWYYLLYGVVHFVPGARRWWLAGGLLLMLGPKIALLAPIWLAGVLLYHWQWPARMPTRMAWPLALLSFAAIWAFHHGNVEPHISTQVKDALGAAWHTQLTFSKFFLSDYVLTVLVFLNFAAMRVVAPSMAPLWAAIESPVRFVAAYTFTLYLLHQPLFLFWAAVLRGDPGGPGYWGLVTALVAGSILLVGHFTESRRHHLRAWLQSRFVRLGAQRRESPA
jgi:peptidoglycan/LPS O-acetylase OafA/YrhL